MMNNLFLNELTSFSKEKLKKTSTDIYYLNGKKFIRKEGEQDELDLNLSKEEMIKKYSESAYLSRQSGYVIDLLPDYSINKIIDGLYISGDDVATNRQILATHKITHVLNATTNVENKFETDLIYKSFLIYDLASQKIDFNISFEFIDQALKQSDANVLVHCNQGVSRSASIVIAFLMQKCLFKTYKEAYEFVKEKRPKIMPNNGFIEQLKQLETQLKQF
jgi:predicted protein tyrosine phosphatase